MLPLVVHWLLVRVAQEASVALVPPLAMASLADSPAAVVAVLALPVRAPTKPVVAVKVGAVTVPVKVGEARGARLGTSAATRDRKLGAPVDPLGLAKTRFAVPTVAAPVPPLAMGRTPDTWVVRPTLPQLGAVVAPPEIRALPVATAVSLDRSEAVSYTHLTLPTNREV